MIRIGVIGIGNMGYNHVRVYNDLNDLCELVAICDTDSKRVEAVGKKFKIKYYTDFRQMIKNEKLDAVSVVVPTDLHTEVGLYCLENGIDVLIEKPISLDIEGAKELIEAARKKNKILMVGHIERFNPAIRFVKKFLERNENGKVISLNSKRYGSIYGMEKISADAILDIGIHDLDVMRYLLDKKIISISKKSFKIIDKKFDDFGIVDLVFDGNIIGRIEVSRLLPFFMKIRELEIQCEKSLIKVNYINQDVSIYMGGESENEFGKEFTDFLLPRAKILTPSIKKEEPLKAELKHFIDCVVNRRKPLVDGEEALENVKLLLGD
jgi:UDP-N-acetylglucosamine 3-dehydrogenase